MFGSTSAFCVFVLFSFFFPRVLEKRGYCSLNSNRKCWLFCSKQCISVLFIDPQIPLFSNFFIKNGSHGTIYTFKNYFATVFLVSVFSFSKNKLNPNRPYIYCLSNTNYIFTISICKIFVVNFVILSMNLLFCLFVLMIWNISIFAYNYLFILLLLSINFLN